MMSRYYYFFYLQTKERQRKRHKKKNLTFDSQQTQGINGGCFHKYMQIQMIAIYLKTHYIHWPLKVMVDVVVTFNSNGLQRYLDSALQSGFEWHSLQSVEEKGHTSVRSAAMISNGIKATQCVTKLHIRKCDMGNQRIVIIISNNAFPCCCDDIGYCLFIFRVCET